MPMGTQAAVSATKAWLQSSWHINVPFAWLETCVEWVQQEGGRLTQQQINQQVLDQWLLADLRDLGHPVLPGGLSGAQKTEITGTFSVQMDSLLDISQPAYGQLQKLRGKDCTNEEVTAVTQATQRPWEARPTRMLLLQVTDGVQNLEAMEYQPIPALNTSLRPGVKILLQGRMVCRLGVLLLGPQNVKILGGEVEDLVDRNNQGRVLCGALGLPAEEQPSIGAAGGNLPALQANHEMEELDLDLELLAGLEAQEELDRNLGSAFTDSGYGTGSSRSSQAQPPLSRSGLSTTSQGRNPVQARRIGPGERGDSGLFLPPPSMRSTQHEVEHFHDEDFDDLPLDELDSMVFEDGPNETPPLSLSEPRGGGSIGSAPNSLRRPPAAEPPSSRSHLNPRGSWSSRPSPNQAGPSHSGAAESQLVPATPKPPMPVTPKPPIPAHQGAPGDAYDPQDLDLMDVDDDPFLLEALDAPRTPEGPGGPAAPPRGGRPSTEAARSAASTPALASPPFTYLRSLQARFPEPRQRPGTCVRVKAFIVTLLGKLGSGSGAWSVRATVSDGTGYLDAELSDPVLARLLGFTVAQKAALRRDPGRRAELDAGMARCKEAMVDMCCVMTLGFREPCGGAVVTAIEPVTEDDLGALEQRVRGREEGK